MIDIHAHLFWDSYDADRDEVVRRAREAGVEKMICVGTSPEDNPRAIAMAEQYENVYASVGLHPHFFNETFVCHSREGGNPESEEKTGSRVKPGMTSMEGCISELKKLAKHPKVVAIGECGLDYYSRDPERPITDEQKAAQKEGFLAQIAIAQELGLPLIVHTRPSAGTMDAYEDVFGILKKYRHSDPALDAGEESRRDSVSDDTNGIPPRRLAGRNDGCFILHCYQGDTEITRKFLELTDVYFSFAGNITYPTKKAAAGTKDDLRKTVRLVPLDRLFVETDCPFLAPQPHRGERNEPAYAAETARFAAAVKGVSEVDIDRAVTENSEKVFFRSL